MLRLFRWGLARPNMKVIGVAALKSRWVRS